MNIFLFEYAVGSNEDVDLHILQEGKLMFDRLLEDFLNNNFTVITVVGERHTQYYRDRDNLKVYIQRDSNVMGTVEEVLNREKIDSALVIAPECDGLLYRLTKLIEEEDILNLGSHSEGVKICGNKYLTYEKIKNIVKTPKTLPPKRYIVKKIDGCGGSNQLIIPENHIIQEYIEGEPYSTSFIVGDKFYPLSLNKQYYRDGRYIGGEINISHPLKDRIIEESMKALEEIEGLNGYVGVDILLDGDTIYILEINPRITTSIVGIYTTPPISQLLVDNAKGKDLRYTIMGSRRITIDLQSSH
ncbi:tyramine--L-glutamate ligase [Methanofervidicoccus abyssi]|uniref:Tyramine---L-glutamate ligase n=1 Tax=Methanofervidicoccus abyssi TaxID=2082189 RepID=A0A401HRG4_9EURY|nr:tyramine--L-glutamate ligase [Methanofervidicoccus abyssi]GBF36805.1 tyramine---L-glutamate ligase [Methanofervidicoccus abyssi]